MLGLAHTVVNKYILRGELVVVIQTTKCKNECFISLYIYTCHIRKPKISVPAYLARPGRLKTYSSWGSVLGTLGVTR